MPLPCVQGLNYTFTHGVVSRYYIFHSKKENTMQTKLLGVVSWTQIKPSSGFKSMLDGKSPFKNIFRPGLGLISVWDTSP